MAESLVNFALCKLKDMINEEAQLLSGVEKQVKDVEAELTHIKHYLKDAESKRRKGDERGKEWLNMLRDVSYRIEDAVDNFHLEHENLSFFGKLKKMGPKHKLANELDDILKDLNKIFKTKDKYEIKPLKGRGRKEADNLSFRRAAYHEVDETEIVGLNSDKRKILKLLRRKKTDRRAVITIVGTGGIGKTTLARMVYNNTLDDFGIHIMITVSQEFSLTDLLIKMINKLHSKPKNENASDLIDQLKGLLRYNRYLIILDDVWDDKVWNQLQHALPDEKNGSRVLMTSRSIDVAISANPGMEPYQLHFLNEKDSLRLLLKKALPEGENCPIDLLELADALSKACKGLPLALLVVGGILSRKGRSSIAWRRVLQTMNWHEEGKECMEVLAMSYKDLPCDLKVCFMHLTSFPEDYQICAKRLIRIWTAEGFIPKEGRKTMEERADDYLEELVQRCMVQVTSRSVNGSIKYFRVHDLLRGMAIQEAKEVNLITVFSNAQCNHPNEVTRRASIQSYRSQKMTSTDQFLGHVGPNTRSLLWFGPKEPLPNFNETRLKNYSEFRLLRVLEIVGVKMANLNYLRGIDQLIHLKYLGIRNSVNLYMPKCSFRRLKNLETLDLRGTDHADLPTDIWTIGTLRHVLYKWPIEGPPSKATIENLQTLQWVIVMRTWQKNQYPHFNNMRKLGLVIQDRSKWDVVRNVLGNMPSLISLGITTEKFLSIPNKIVYPRLLPNYGDLQSLHLQGRWSDGVTLDATMFPPHLVKLKLVDSEVVQDPMPELGKLEGLKKLILEGAVYIGWQMNCASGFPVLESLALEITHGRISPAIKIAQEAMPKLKYLTQGFYVKLEMPDERSKSIIIKHAY